MYRRKSIKAAEIKHYINWLGWVEAKHHQSREKIEAAGSVPQTAAGLEGAPGVVPTAAG